VECGGHAAAGSPRDGHAVATPRHGLGYMSGGMAAALQFAARRDRDATIETFAISPDGTHAVLSILEPASDLMITDGIESLNVR